MKAGEIKGKTVVSIENGVKMGSVDDVLFDPRALRIAALGIKAADQRAIVPFEEVRSIGADAVTVPSDAVARWGATGNRVAEGLPNLDAFKHMKVVDEAGTYLGTVRDVEVSAEDGRIIRLDAHKGGVLGVGGDTATIPAEQITSVGPDVIVVPQRAHSGA